MTLRAKINSGSASRAPSHYPLTWSRGEGFKNSVAIHSAPRRFTCKRLSKNCLQLETPDTELPAAAAIDALSVTRECRKMTSPAAADLVRGRKPGEVGARFAPANRVTGEGAGEAALAPRVQIVLVRQYACGFALGPQTHTLTLS